MICKSMVFLGLCCFFILFSSGVHADWWNSSYDFRTTITVSKDAGSTEHTNEIARTWIAFSGYEPSLNAIVLLDENDTEVDFYRWYLTNNTTHFSNAQIIWNVSLSPGESLNYTLYWSGNTSIDVYDDSSIDWMFLDFNDSRDISEYTTWSVDSGMDIWSITGGYLDVVEMSNVSSYAECTSPSRICNYPSNFIYDSTIGSYFDNGSLSIIVITEVAHFSYLSGNGDGTFQGPVNYTTGSTPCKIFTGDFDNDSNLDVVVTNSANDDLSYFSGNGDGTFQGKVDYPTGSTPRGLFTGDFDNNGTLDVIVANEFDDTFSYLSGNGDGTFQGPVNYTTEDSPWNIFAGDFDNNGTLDVVVTAWNVNKFSYLSGNGDGTFQGKVDYTTGAVPKGIFAGDFDNDSNLDVVVTNSEGGTFSYFEGNGDGTFQGKVDYPTTDGYPAEIYGGDFNGDGYLDLVVANEFNDTFSYFEGNGDGTFQGPVNYTAGNNPFGIFAGDFDNNGTLDVILANQLDGTISYFSGNGDGTFQSKVDYHIGGIPYTIYAGNFGYTTSPHSVILPFYENSQNYISAETKFNESNLSLVVKITGLQAEDIATHDYNSGDRLLLRYNTTDMISHTLTDYTNNLGVNVNKDASGKTAQNFNIMVNSSGMNIHSICFYCWYNSSDNISVSVSSFEGANPPTIKSVNLTRSDGIDSFYINDNISCYGFVKDNDSTQNINVEYRIWGPSGSLSSPNFSGNLTETVDCLGADWVSGKRCYANITVNITDIGYWNCSLYARDVFNNSGWVNASLFSYMNNSQPGAVSNIQPDNITYDSTPLISWNSSQDNDTGQEIVYYIRIGNTSSGSEIFDWRTSGNNTSYQVPGADTLPLLKTYYIQVFSSDQSGESNENSSVVEEDVYLDDRATIVYNNGTSTGLWNINETVKTKAECWYQGNLTNCSCKARVIGKTSFTNLTYDESHWHLGDLWNIPSGTDTGKYYIEANCTYDDSSTEVANVSFNVSTDLTVSITNLQSSYNTGDTVIFNVTVYYISGNPYIKEGYTTVTLSGVASGSRSYTTKNENVFTFNLGSFSSAGVLSVLAKADESGYSLYGSDSDSALIISESPPAPTGGGGGGGLANFRITPRTIDIEKEIDEPRDLVIEGGTCNDEYGIINTGGKPIRVVMTVLGWDYDSINSKSLLTVTPEGQDIALGEKGTIHICAEWKGNSVPYYEAGILAETFGKSEEIRVKIVPPGTLGGEAVGKKVLTEEQKKVNSGLFLVLTGIGTFLILFFYSKIK